MGVLTTGPSSVERLFQAIVLIPIRIACISNLEANPCSRNGPRHLAVEFTVTYLSPRMFYARNPSPSSALPKVHLHPRYTGPQYLKQWGYCYERSIHLSDLRVPESLPGPSEPSLPSESLENPRLAAWVLTLEEYPESGLLDGSQLELIMWIHGYG